MTTIHETRKIAFVGDYLPRQCGIATFTHDLCTSIATEYPESECIVVPVNDREQGYIYPEEVRFEMREQEILSYERAADFLNFNNTGAISLQHEFGIYGGPDGSHVLALLRHLRVPVVTTLHTVLREPSANQMRVMQELSSLSARLVVMSRRGFEFLTDIYGVPEHKIDIIPHGIPDMPFVDPNFYKDQFDVEGKNVLLTFGLLSPNKGIENVLKALPEVVAKYPETVYIVLGATHPKLLREHGESYRMSLERLVRDLDIRENVVFYNRFVEPEELQEFIGAADIYITPYLNEEQITSGTLAYAFGCGKAVVSTPYWHAQELLADGRGVLVPFADPGAIARELITLLRDEPRRHAMRKKAYLLGRKMVWSHVAQLYMESFQKAREMRLEKNSRSLSIKIAARQRGNLPDIRLDHLIRMSDSTGIFQHAKFSIPNFAEGYCTDDNARALLLTILLDELGYQHKQLRQLTSGYAAFLNYAFDAVKKRFRNFMAFDRTWLEEVGSDDSQGRAIWALGACVGRSKQRDLQMWAAQLLEQAFPMVSELKHPRSWAFALLGIHEYFRRLSGDRFVDQLRDELTYKLIEVYEKNATEDWPWFEKRLTYDNAKLPHALILSGRWGNDGRAFDIGLRSLRWLTEIQTAEAGHFRPIGNDGFYPYGGKRATFDQQPLEAAAMVSACLEAYLDTRDTFWFDEAKKAFEWFLGKNDLGLAVYDSKTGGCHDAVHSDRLNQNQGAESTLSFLLSLAELHIVENTLTAFEQPTRSVETNNHAKDGKQLAVGHESKTN